MTLSTSWLTELNSLQMRWLMMVLQNMCSCIYCSLRHTLSLADQQMGTARRVTDIEILLLNKQSCSRIADRRRLVLIVSGTSTQVRENHHVHQIRFPAGKNEIIAWTWDVCDEWNMFLVSGLSIWDTFSRNWLYLALLNALRDIFGGWAVVKEVGGGGRVKFIRAKIFGTPLGGIESIV